MKNYLNILGSLVIATTLIVGASVVSAASTESSLGAKAVYPIADLGNCKDQKACKAFCEKSDNMLSCVTYAEKSGLLSGEDLRLSKLVATKISKGETPGGCKDKTSCENFCKGKVENINQCIAFAEELGVLPAEELAQAKNVAKALAQGAKLPGSCKEKNDCEKYCAIGSHIDECLSFAEAANILSGEELKQAKAVAPYLKSGETPGKCQTKAECDSYCADTAHFGECVDFAAKAGFISAEDLAIVKKTGGVGPGGCKSKDSCATYCEDINHATECANYAIEKGLVDEKTAELIKNGIDQMTQGLGSLPGEIRTDVENCMKDKIGADSYTKLIAKQITPTQNMGKSIESCFADIEAKVKAYIMQQSGGQGVGMPSREEIMKNIPDNVPAAYRSQIEQKVNEQFQSGGSAPSQTPSVAPTGSQGSGPDCSAFAAMPSADYCTAAGQYAEQCRKCKGN